MNFHLAGNLVAQNLRDEKLALKAGGSGTKLAATDQRKNNRRKINQQEVEALERLYRESSIVAAAVDQICDDIESGYLAIDSNPSDAIKEGFKPQKTESASYKSLLMKLGVDFCRAILLYRMCIVAIPRTKEAPFIAPVHEYNIEFEQLVAGGRWYYVSHRLSDKDRFQEEPVYFLAIVNEPDIHGNFNSPLRRLVEDFNLVSIKRAISIATDISNLVPHVYATKDVKDKQEEDKAPGFFMGEDQDRLHRESEDAERLKKAQETGAINIPAAAPLVQFEDLMSKVIKHDGEKTPLEKLVGLLEANAFKSATIIQTNEQKLIPASRPPSVSWIEDHEMFAQAVAMATKYPSDFWKSSTTRVSSAAENSREKKQNCLRGIIHKVEQFLEFLVNEDYNRVIDRFNEIFADNDADKILTIPVNGGIGSGDVKQIEPRIDPVAGSHAYEFGAAGHLPVSTTQTGPSESNPDVPLKQHTEQIKTDVLGEVLDGHGKKREERTTVRIILPISKEELIELDAMGRVDGKTMQFMLAAQYGGSPEWFNQEAKLPVPPAPKQPGGIGGSSKRKKTSGGGSSAAKTKKKPKKTTTAVKKPKKPGSTTAKKPKKPASSRPKGKSVRASATTYHEPQYPYFDEESSYSEGEEDVDAEREEEEEEEEEDVGPVEEEWSSEGEAPDALGGSGIPMSTDPLLSISSHPLPLPSNLTELSINHLLNNGIQ